MNKRFIMRRLHSLTGVIPLGLFLIYHLYGQLYLHHGARVYNEYFNGFYDHPLSVLALIFVVYVPLLLHGVLGCVYCLEAKIQPQYQYFNHLLFWLQRISGLGVLFFVLAHLWFVKFSQIFAETYGYHFEHITEGFNDPNSGWLTKLVYIFGILGATFHFSNGLHTFCMTWGIALTEKALVRMRTISIVIFIILTLIAFYSIYAIR